MHLRVFNMDLVGMHIWRQTETQTVINNFVQEDMNILNPRINDDYHTGRIHRMEFPVMQWIFACIHKVLGPSITTSRILSFIIGVFSLLGIFRLGSTLFKNELGGLISTWVLCFSPLFYYYMVNPLPDNLSLCCAIWGITYYVRYANTSIKKHLILSSLLLCFAALAKLPYITFAPIIVGHLIISNKNASYKTKTLLLFSLPFILPIIWYASVIPTWKGNGVVNGLLDTSTYTLSSLFSILLGATTSLLPEILVNYGAVLPFVAGIYFLFAKKKYKHPYFLPLLMSFLGVTAYYLFEINMITLVHDYYYMPFLPFIVLLITYGATQLLKTKYVAVKALVVLCMVSLPALAYFRMDGRWNTTKPGFNPVYYHNKEEIRAVIPQGALCVVGHDESPHILLYYIDKKGWSYRSEELNQYDLSFYIASGADYFLTDCNIEEREAIKAFLDKLVYQKDDLKIYKLKTKEEI